MLTFGADRIDFHAPWKSARLHSRLGAGVAGRCRPQKRNSSSSQPWRSSGSAVNRKLLGPGVSIRIQDLESFRPIQAQPQIVKSRLFELLLQLKIEPRSEEHTSELQSPCNLV